jgi:muramoyltetrapeptide carboxypeptidase
MQNKIWQPLIPGDAVDIIAPAGRLPKENITKLANLLTSWQLKVNVAEDILGDDLLCANSDAARLKHLQSALLNPHSKAVVCARGGYGAMRLMPELFKLPVPNQVKLFVGMSDITAINIFLQQQWHWATLHAALSVWRLAEPSIKALKHAILGEVPHITFTELRPLNREAAQTQLINSTVVGGNLCLVQCSIGTSWQLDTQDKIILLEETGERAYKIDRMLEQLYQAGLFKQAKAVVFGDFIKGEEPNGTSLIAPVLQRFAERLTIPVIQIPGIGHDSINYPIPLGTPAQLQLGSTHHLCCQLVNNN